jgi:hypothetical protein
MTPRILETAATCVNGAPTTNHRIFRPRAGHSAKARCGDTLSNSNLPRRTSRPVPGMQRADLGSQRQCNFSACLAVWPRRARIPHDHVHVPNVLACSNASSQAVACRGTLSAYLQTANPKFLGRSGAAQRPATRLRQWNIAPPRPTPQCQRRRLYRNRLRELCFSQSMSIAL